MSKRKTFDLAEDLISVVEEEQIEQIEKDNTVLYASADSFIPYNNESLRLKELTGEQRERLKESISTNGIMVPVIATLSQTGTPLILAGHNRVEIAKELGIKVPYILKNNMSKEEEELIVIDTNLLNRQLDDYKPSQLAYVLEVKRKAEKNDTEFAQRTTMKQIGEKYKLSKTQIFLYLKINNLIQELMDLADDKKLNLKIAYELSFLNKQDQKKVYTYFFKNDNGVKLNLKMAKEIKSASSQNALCANVLNQISQTTKSSSSLSEPKRLDYKKVMSYIPEDVEDVDEFIIKAIEAYKGENV